MISESGGFGNIVKENKGLVEPDFSSNVLAAR